MGGVVALTLRMRDGTEHRMERWTNILPGYIRTIPFYEGDESVWEEAIEHWYTELAKGQKGETIITSWKMYDHPYLVPSEYGILVIDYVTMTVVDAQDYLGITTINPFYQKVFKELKDRDMIGKDLFPDVVDDKLWKLYEIKQDTWKVFKYDRTSNGLRKTKEKIKELGFKLSEKEEELWDQKIAEEIEIEIEAGDII